MSKKAKLVQHLKTISVIHYISSLRKKNHIIVSIQAEKKATDKILQPRMIKILSKLVLEENILNPIKDSYENRTTITFDCDRLKALTLRLGKRQRCHSHHFYLTL